VRIDIKKFWRRKKTQQPKSYVLGSQVKNQIIVDEFVEYINYTRNMGFEQDPDYDYLKSLFHNVMQAHGLVNDNEFDWMPKNSGLNVNYCIFKYFKFIRII